MTDQKPTAEEALTVLEKITTGPTCAWIPDNATKAVAIIREALESAQSVRAELTPLLLRAECDRDELRSERDDLVKEVANLRDSLEEQLENVAFYKELYESVRPISFFATSPKQPFDPAQDEAEHLERVKERMDK